MFATDHFNLNDDNRVSEAIAEGLAASMQETMCMKCPKWTSGCTAEECVSCTQYFLRTVAKSLKGEQHV